MYDLIDFSTAAFKCATNYNFLVIQLMFLYRKKYANSFFLLNY